MIKSNFIVQWASSLLIITYYLFTFRRGISGDYNLSALPDLVFITYGIISILLFMIALKLKLLTTNSRLIICIACLLCIFVALDLIAKIKNQESSLIGNGIIFLGLGFLTGYLYPSVRRGVLLSSVTIFFGSFVLFGLISPMLGLDLILSEHYFNDSRVIIRNSGIILNNNALGSIMSLLYGFLIFEVWNKFERRTKIIFYFTLIISTIIFSGNFTSIFVACMCILIANYWRKFTIPEFIMILSIVISLFAYIFFSFSDYISYKFFNSAAIKITLLMANLAVFLEDFDTFMFGVKARNFWSESSLINLMAEVGVVITVLFLSLILYLFQASSSKNGSSNISYPLIFISLSVVQNSAFIPINFFVVGLLVRHGYKVKEV